MKIPSVKREGRVVISESELPETYGLNHSQMFLMEGLTLEGEIRESDDEAVSALKKIGKIRDGKYATIGGLAVKSWFKGRVPTLDADVVGDAKFQKAMKQRYGAPIKSSNDALTFDVDGVEVDVLKSTIAPSFKAVLDRRVIKNGIYIADRVSMALLKILAVNSIYRVLGSSKGLKDVVDILNLVAGMSKGERKDFLTASVKGGREIQADAQNAVNHVETGAEASISVYEIAAKEVKETKEVKMGIDSAMKLVKANKSIMMKGKWYTVIRGKKGMGFLVGPATWKGNPTDKNTFIIPWDKMKSGIKGGSIKIKKATASGATVDAKVK